MSFHRVDGVHMLELLPSILLTGSEGTGKSTIVETVARRLYLHVQQVGMEVKGLCLVGHDQVHHHGNSGKAAVPACSAGGYGSEGPLFGRA